MQSVYDSILCHSTYTCVDVWIANMPVVKCLWIFIKLVPLQVMSTCTLSTTWRRRRFFHSNCTVTEKKYTVTIRVCWKNTCSYACHNYSRYCLQYCIKQCHYIRSAYSTEYACAHQINLCNPLLSHSDK